MSASIIAAITCNPAPTARANSLPWTSRANSVNATHARLGAPVAALVELASPYLWNRQVPVGSQCTSARTRARSSSVSIPTTT
jgi:hypothetical protein